MSKEIKDEGSPGDKNNGAWTELDKRQAKQGGSTTYGHICILEE